MQNSTQQIKFYVMLLNAKKKENVRKKRKFKINKQDCKQANISFLIFTLRPYNNANTYNIVYNVVISS